MYSKLDTITLNVKDFKELRLSLLVMKEDKFQLGQITPFG